MAVSQFNADELRALIAGYESDKKKLDYQTNLIEKTLGDLRKKLDREEAKEKKAAARAAKKPARRGRKPGPKKATTGRRGRPAKAATTTTTTTEAVAEAPKKRRGRPAGAKNKAATTKKTATTARKAAPKAAAKPVAKAAAAKPKTTAKKGAKGYRLNEMDELVIGLIEKNGKAMISSELVTAAMEARGMTENEAKTMLNRTLHKLANRRSDLKKVPYAGRGFAYALPAWVNAAGKAKRQYKHS